MQTPVEIDFQDFEASEEIRASIEQHILELERRCGRVTSCRVVVKGPGGRHQSGGLYDINVHLSLPNGREVNVGRTPQQDERRSDLTFAIDDAFKRARRRLQDQVRRTQGQVKQHEPQATATVIRIDPAGGFGFLQSADGREIYFHRNSVLSGAFDRITVGMRVSFAEEMGEKGPQASTVKRLGKHNLRP